jgi:hypothetical protein
MVWSHCDNDDVLDDQRCPVCGMSKAEWTVKVGATRVFKVSLPKRAADGWLELALQDPDGQPARARATFWVDLPSGRRVEGVLQDGAARVDGIPRGECRVTIDGLRPRPADAPEPAPPGPVRLLVADRAPDDESGLECATGEVHTLRRCHWLEVQVLDEAGFPVAEEPFAVEFEDGTPRHEGLLDADGFARVDGLLRDGPCDLVFPWRQQPDLRLEDAAP